MPLFGSNQPDNGQDTQNSLNIPQPAAFSGARKTAPATIIAKGVRLEGDFKSQGDVLIEGEVNGSIQTDSLLTVGPEAAVKAGITAADAVIAGRIDGNINIKNRLEVKSTAQIMGDLFCLTAVIEGGAKLQGNIRCGGEIKVEELKKSEPAKPIVLDKPKEESAQKINSQ